MTRSVFVDTSYWVAMANPRDQHASAAKAAREQLGDALLVTTDEVLTEFLNGFRKSGAYLRGVAVKIVKQVLDNTNVEVVHQSRRSFVKGMELYRQRADTQYSLVDCISMCTMRAKGLREVLTADGHFAREGFTVLIRP